MKHCLIQEILMNRIFTLIVLAMTALLTACGTVGQPSANSNIYGSSSAYRAQYVSYGTVVNARQVILQGGDSVGTIAGAVVGGLLGNQVGGGRGRIVGTMAGVLAGATVGKAIDRNASQQVAQEIIVRRYNGGDFAVIQGLDQSFRPGDPVTIVQDGNSVRISHY
jgi:outer membrane lipoprotein SlyB